MHGLKSLVVVMGALIAVGLGVLVYGIYYQVNDSGGDVIAKTAKTFADMNITLPASCHISKMTPAREQKIFLLIGPPSPPCERVIIVDTANATLMGTINIKSER